MPMSRLRLPSATRAFLRRSTRTSLRSARPRRSTTKRWPTLATAVLSTQFQASARLLRREAVSSETRAFSKKSVTRLCVPPRVIGGTHLWRTNAKPMCMATALPSRALVQRRSRIARSAAPVSSTRLPVAPRWTRDLSMACLLCSGLGPRTCPCLPRRTWALLESAPCLVASWPALVLTRVARPMLLLQDSPTSRY